MLGLALLFALSCATPRARYSDGVVTRDVVKYRIGEPGEPWEPGKTADWGDVLFRHPESGAVLSANSTCNRYEDSPLRRLAENLLWGITGRQKLREGILPMAGREAYELELDGKLDGVPVRLYIRVLKKDACIFDFSCTAQPERFETVRETCLKFIDGFEDLR